MKEKYNKWNVSENWSARAMEGITYLTGTFLLARKHKTASVIWAIRKANPIPRRVHISGISNQWKNVNIQWKILETPKLKVILVTMSLTVLSVREISSRWVNLDVATISLPTLCTSGNEIKCDSWQKKKKEEVETYFSSTVME